MEHGAETAILGLAEGTFFQAFWRQRPLHVRGGGRAILETRWDGAAFERIASDARAVGRTSERPGEVCFIERISDFEPELAGIAKRWRHWFGAQGAWFDGVRTEGVSGIGRHFDHSDNFVLQQQGTKRWRLASSSYLSPEAVARRMLGTGGGEAAPFSGEVVEVELQPGDLLYIPLFWVHEGVSCGDSLSLSLVLPATSAHAVTLPVLAEVLRRAQRGHRALPMLHAGLSAEERRAALEEIAAEGRALLTFATDDAVVRAVALLQERLLTGKAK